MLARNSLDSLSEEGRLDKNKSAAIEKALSSHGFGKASETRLLVGAWKETSTQIINTITIARDPARLWDIITMLMIRKVKRAPGYGLMRLLRFVCSRRFMERELKQVHDDGLFELYEAEQAGDRKLARVIPWRLRGHLLLAAGGGLANWILGKVGFSFGGKPDC